MTDHEPDSHDELMEAREAAEYLAKKWGLEHYSIDAFKQLRYRWNLEPALKGRRSTWWRKSQLDVIPKPDRTKPRQRRKKTEDSQEEPGTSSSVRLLRSTVPLAC